MNRNKIEAILKINGISPSSPDEEIRSVLLSARYNKDEVDTAIMVLRQDIKTKQTRVDGLHKVFRTDTALRPDEISHLLGIDVDITKAVEVGSKSRDLSIAQIILVVVLSVSLAVAGVMIYMYFNQFGAFHPSLGF